MPKTLESQGQVERATNSRLAVFVDFDRVLMKRLDQLGCLTNLTRLEVLVDKQCYLEEHMPHLTNLIKLGLTVTSLKAITYVLNINFPHGYNQAPSPLLLFQVSSSPPEQLTLRRFSVA